MKQYRLPSTKSENITLPWTYSLSSSKYLMKFIDKFFSIFQQYKFWWNVNHNNTFTYSRIIFAHQLRPPQTFLKTFNGISHCTTHIQSPVTTKKIAWPSLWMHQTSSIMLTLCASVSSELQFPNYNFRPFQTQTESLKSTLKIPDKCILLFILKN